MQKGDYQGQATAYSGQYPDLPEFQDPQAHCVQVSQGCAEISSHKPVISEGFAQCSSFIMVNLDTNSSVVFHLDFHG